MPVDALESEALISALMTLPPELAQLDVEAYMREALHKAEQAGIARERPIGAVLVVKGEIVSRGRARHRETPSRLAHAEMNALLDGGDPLWHDYDQAVLFTTREPCPLCLGATVMADVPHIVFAEDDSIVHTIDTLAANPHVRWHIKTYLGGVLANEAMALSARFNHPYRHHKENSGTENW